MAKGPAPRHAMTKFPRDPLISRHPQPMTAAEARREVRRATQLRRRVPLGHPYGVAPVWTPYPLARLLAALVRAFAGPGAVSGSRPRRRSGSAHKSRGRSR